MGARGRGGAVVGVGSGQLEEREGGGKEAGGVFRIGGICCFDEGLWGSKGKKAIEKKRKTHLFFHVFGALTSGK